MEAAEGSVPSDDPPGRARAPVMNLTMGLPCGLPVQGRTAEGPYRLPDRQHPIQRDLGPVLLLRGDADAVVDLAVHQPFEHPEQMIGRNAEHRRAEAAEGVEREHRAIWRDFVRETVDE